MTSWTGVRLLGATLGAVLIGLPSLSAHHQLESHGSSLPPEAIAIDDTMAKDGMDLPADQATERPSEVQVGKR